MPQGLQVRKEIKDFRDHLELLDSRVQLVPPVLLVLKEYKDLQELQG